MEYPQFLTILLHTINIIASDPVNPDAFNPLIIRIQQVAVSLYYDILDKLVET